MARTATAEIRSCDPEALQRWLARWRWAGRCETKVKEPADNGWPIVCLNIEGGAGPWPDFDARGRSERYRLRTEWARELALLATPGATVYLCMRDGLGRVHELAAAEGTAVVRSGWGRAHGAQRCLEKAQPPSLWEVGVCDGEHHVVLAESLREAQAFGAALANTTVAREEEFERTREEQEAWRDEPITLIGERFEAAGEPRDGEKLWVQADDGSWMDSGLTLDPDGRTVGSMQEREVSCAGRSEIAPNEDDGELWVRNGTATRKIGCAVQSGWSAASRGIRIPHARWPVELVGWTEKLALVRNDEKDGESGLSALARTGLYVPITRWRIVRWYENPRPQHGWLERVRRKFAGNGASETETRGDFAVRAYRWTTQRWPHDDGPQSWDDVAHETDLTVHSGQDQRVLVDEKGMSVTVVHEDGRREVVQGEGAEVATALRRAGVQPMRFGAVSITPWEDNGANQTLAGAGTDRAGSRSQNSSA